MNCQESEQLIQDFIDDRLAGDELEAFLYHIGRCSSCFDEMETSFLLKEALARLEDGTSFDLHSELKEKIALMEKCVRFRNRLAVVRRVVLTVAGLILAVDLVAMYLYYI